MKVYISGPITGQPNAIEKFNEAKGTIKMLNENYEPISPMDLPHNHDKSWKAHMKEDIKTLMECDAIYLMEGWKNSIGAKIEKEIAENLSYKIIYELK